MVMNRPRCTNTQRCGVITLVPNVTDDYKWVPLQNGNIFGDKWSQLELKHIDERHLFEPVKCDGEEAQKKFNEPRKSSMSC